MVLGKRTRASTKATVARTGTSSRESSPASSVRASPPPPPSLKRAKTCPTIVTLDGIKGKENIAPNGWFISGRSVDAHSERDEDTEDEDEDEEPTRVTRSRTTVVHVQVRRRPGARRVNTTIPLATPPTSPTKDAFLSPTLSVSTACMVIDSEESISVLSPTKSQSVYSKARGLLRCNTRMNWSFDGSLSPETSIAARDTERTTIKSFLTAGDFLQRSPREDALSSLYISGSPGTGKTALVTDILHRLSQEDGNAERIAVYVNCTGLGNVVAVWHKVWTKVVAGLGESSKSDVKPKDAKRRLEAVLSDDDAPRIILVLDELDFISQTPTALSEIYNLAHRHPTTLRLIGISNTLNLGSNSSSSPSKLARTNSSSSIAGPQKTLNFSAYTAPDLLAILNARLAALTEEERTIFTPVVLNFLSKKVAATNGDIRYALSVLRRCVDTAEKEATGKLEMKHVLESLRAHESGSVSSATEAKGSGVSRTTRNLGLHARLALIAILIGRKRLASGLPLILQFGSSNKSTAPMKLTPSTLYDFYVSLLTSSVLSEDGTSLKSTPFVPVSRGEFQDIVGVLETSGLIAHSAFTPESEAPSPRTSSVSSFTLPMTPPKTPTRPRTTGRSVSMQSLTLSGRKKSGGSAELNVVLAEGVREEEVVRGLTIASAEKVGVVEKELQALLEREMRRVGREVSTRERKAGETMEKARMDALAFDQDD